MPNGPPSTRRPPAPFHDRRPAVPDDLFIPEESDDLKIVFIGLQRTAKPTALAA
ncbi:hypothetical protein ABT126_27365 [Streptomyces sp. NPDC002012]|uniref:hypothetical protein n=1 Tax=unclassified Streptomyces TaxID=2593676 RepID=UPI00331BB72E